MATPKHYIGDGGTLWGTSTTEDFQIDQGDVRMDEAQLRARYLPPYEAAIAAEARTIMVSFSSWNGTKMHANEYLLTDVLKTELGFDGFLVSDWAGIDQIPGDYPSDIVTSINAGVDMVMVPFEYEAFITGLTDAVERGEVSEERIDDAVGRILRVKLDMGLFELPFPDESALADVGSVDHRALARAAVQASAVLLKNADATLPLDPATPLVFMAGAGAHDIGLQSGGWTIDGQGSPGAITPGTTIYDGVRAIVSPETRVELDPSGNFAAVTDEAGQPAVADVAIVVLAEQPYSEGAGDRADLRSRRRISNCWHASGHAPSGSSSCCCRAVRSSSPTSSPTGTPSSPPGCPAPRATASPTCCSARHPSPRACRTRGHARTSSCRSIPPHRPNRGATARSSRGGFGLTTDETPPPPFCASDG